MNNNLKIIKIRKHVFHRDQVVFQGAVYDCRLSHGVVAVLVDGKEVEANISYREGRDIWALYRLPGHMVTEEITIEIPHSALNDADHVEIYATVNGIMNRLYKTRVKQVEKLLAESMCQVDEIKLAAKKNAAESARESATESAPASTRESAPESKQLKIRGWAVYDKERTLTLRDVAGNELPYEISYSKRRDAEESFSEIDPLTYANEIGFLITVDHFQGGKLSLVATCDGDTQLIEIDPGRSGETDQASLPAKMVRYLRYNGAKSFFLRIGEKMGSGKVKQNDQNYMDWLKLHEPTVEDIEKQYSHEFAKDITFSIAVPLYHTPRKYLSEMIESVQAQTYSKWQLCLADGSEDDSIGRYIAENYGDDSRISYQHLMVNEGISGNTNAALSMATGDYVALCDHDDLLAPNALYELMRVIEAHDDADVIYTDEDKIDRRSKKRFDPYFKSDFNIDLLCANNYICHLFAFSRQMLNQVGQFRQEFDGAQDHDFILRCVEEARQVYHVPMVLYHWRCHEDSTASNPESKLYAYEAGLRAVQAHFDRIGVEVRMEDGLDYGFYHPHHIVHGEPLVSILIPNKDHTDDLDVCLKSLRKSTYQNFEVIVIENNSTEDETFEYYKSIDGHDKTRVVYYDGDFNFSKINNFGAREAKGEYLLFLNNDIEAITDNWLEEMLGFCQREDVGIVGAQLFYPDQTLQHAGVVIGIGGIAGHTFVGQTPKEANAFGRANSVQDYSAVTAACMLTKTEVFHEVGMFDETLKVAFNDIDYCLKVRSTGRLVVYNPKAQMYHYESKSRGYEDTPEKQERFASEVARFKEKWSDILSSGDPYYNPNLTLEKADMSLNEVI